MWFPWYVANYGVSSERQHLFPLSVTQELRDSLCPSLFFTSDQVTPACKVTHELTTIPFSVVCLSWTSYTFYINVPDRWIIPTGLHEVCEVITLKCIYTATSSCLFSMQLVFRHPRDRKINLITEDRQRLLKNSSHLALRHTEEEECLVGLLCIQHTWKKTPFRLHIFSLSRTQPGCSQPAAPETEAVTTSSTYRFNLHS